MRGPRRERKPLRQKFRLRVGSTARTQQLDGRDDRAHKLPLRGPLAQRTAGAPCGQVATRSQVDRSQGRRRADAAARRPGRGATTERGRGGRAGHRGGASVGERVARWCRFHCETGGFTDSTEWVYDIRLWNYALSPEVK